MNVHYVSVYPLLKPYSLLLFTTTTQRMNVLNETLFSFQIGANEVNSR